MVSKHNPEQGPTELWAVVDIEDGELIMLEGRPAIFESLEAAIRGRKRMSRPAKAEVRQVKRLDLVKIEVGDRQEPIHHDLTNQAPQAE